MCSYGVNMHIIIKLNQYPKVSATCTLVCFFPRLLSMYAGVACIEVRSIVRNNTVSFFGTTFYLYSLCLRLCSFYSSHQKIHWLRLCDIQILFKIMFCRGLKWSYFNLLLLSLTYSNITVKNVIFPFD